MSDIKISDKLLSWVLWCEVIRNNAEKCKTDHTEGFTLWYTSIKDNKETPHAVNLDTFIRLAKIKCFECGYAIIETPFDCRILDARNHNEIFNITINTVGYDTKSYSMINVLQLLEEVADKVGGKG